MARTKAFDQDKARAQAMQVFWHSGYAATSIEDLVETLQLSRSSLYDTYGDKRTLFLSVLRQYSQQVISRMTAVLQRSPSPIAAVQAIFDDLTASVNTAQGAQGCFMVNSVAELVPFDAEVTQIAAAYSSAVQQILAQSFARAQAEGVIQLQFPAEHLAAYVFNTIQGMRLLIKSGATREQLQSIVGITLKLLS